ncbi:MAG: hypothetical protein EOO27_09430 [Comamonadaceae bacterium]|nr:MAG: hypothetical protein EOO27_09430 [Comamonadaceae bacterium]
MNVLRRRGHLSAKDQAQCGTLDGLLARLEAAAPTASARDKAKADFELDQARKQFFDLKC